MNLKTGVPPDSNNETCTAGAGSLLVEFGILSRLLGDSTFEWVARRAVKALWSLRSSDTGLLGAGTLSGLGAESITPCPFLFSGALPPLHSFFLVPWNLKIDSSERGPLSVSVCDFSLRGRLEGLMAWNHAFPI